ncbi:succinate dehydrogenase cytochrome b subunit [Sediminibacterium sp.]|uniref:succinate dehydrogenase cytochrome b subunit n=1 Tax=Sediminibacterium sp. TaxID=1917865 RepID=UPI00273423D0|nr:succinate dehydrogenase cytochrome b subunit [Sediminibacterium sp.]MDP3567567.1 succinate dehydrogenase cytochrome b subunit [Sediminibacterium sp.]
MSKKSGFLSSSIGKKFIMGITGLFLVSFLAVHCFINSLIFFNDGGLTFNTGAHFMASNWLIRFGEIVLFAGLILHMIQALVLTLENKKARPIGYAKFNGAANSTWYSRSMGLLGTLLLMFLIIHLAHFWVKSRFTGLPGEDANGHENLYAVMQTTFTQLWVVIIYCLAMISLAYHLLHGFQSAFQTLGINHKKYTPFIKMIGTAFSIIVPLIFAAMPVLMHFCVIK